jgi:hypothetical protein
MDGNSKRFGKTKLPNNGIVPDRWGKARTVTNLRIKKRANREHGLDSTS